MEMFFLLFVPLLLLVLLDWLPEEFCPFWMFFLKLNLCCRLFRAHGGKQQACKAFLMCSISLWSACWLVKTIFALCAKVLKTLCFAMMKWLLSQCRNWSVCVGFL